jgi:hypothetical protein
MARRRKTGIQKWINSLKVDLKKPFDWIFFMGGEKIPEDSPGPSWKFRRKLIFGAYRLSVAMIIFGAVTFFWDTGVSNNLVTGGIAILTIIITAYTATATWQDIKFNKDSHNQE